MVWQEQSAMSLREEFVMFASQEGANRRALCRRYGISPKTGYKWLDRAEDAEPGWSEDHSRRPHRAPHQTAAAIETEVIAARLLHPTWGGRKLYHWLRDQGMTQIPAPSTITAILRRNDLLDPMIRAPNQTVRRFEHPHPNALWQLDFMGHHPMVTNRLHPLTLIDDHSRFALGLWACGHQRGSVVQQHLTAAFRHYGLPLTILTDNGPPWGAVGQGGITAIEAWLIRLGVRVTHGRPYHPQTQGKVERLHGTMAVDLFRTRHYADLPEAQVAFDTWRQCYNLERPHEALDYAVPASRYHPSPLVFPDVLPPIEYGPDDAVRMVRGQGAISFHNRIHFISRGLIGSPVAVRPTTKDGVFTVYYCHQHVTTIDQRVPKEV